MDKGWRDDRRDLADCGKIGDFSRRLLLMVNKILARPAIRQPVAGSGHVEQSCNFSHKFHGFNKNHD